MKKDIKDKWIAALRSGKYEQGQNNLRSVDDKFCCLGVLCDIIDNSKWETFEKANSAKKQYPYTYNGYSGVLSYEMTKELKFKNTETKTLIIMNDSGKTFAEIADYIEANL